MADYLYGEVRTAQPAKQRKAAGGDRNMWAAFVCLASSFCLVSPENHMGFQTMFLWVCSHGSPV